eukprot:scaffold25837_cov52-Phaeocystis_antarctica.AAC.1
MAILTMGRPSPASCWARRGVSARARAGRTRSGRSLPPCVCMNDGSPPVRTTFGWSELYSPAMICGGR